MDCQSVWHLSWGRLGRLAWCNYHSRRASEIRTRSTAECGEPRARLPVMAVLRRPSPVAAPAGTGLAAGPGKPSAQRTEMGGERYLTSTPCSVPTPRTHHSERTPLPPCVATSSPRPGACGSHQVPPLSPPLPQPSSAKTQAGYLYAATPAGREAPGVQRRAAGRGSVDPGSLAASTPMYPDVHHPRSPIPCPRMFGRACPLQGLNSRQLPTLPVPNLSRADLHTPPPPPLSGLVQREPTTQPSLPTYLPCHTPHRDEPPFLLPSRAHRQSRPLSRSLGPSFARGPSSAAS